MNALRFGIIAGLAVALAALPVVLWANVVPEPRDAAAQVRILGGILTESNGRWNLQTVDLFEKQHAYATRGASDMLEDVRFVERMPGNAAFDSECTLIEQHAAGEAHAFQSSMLIHTAFTLPGQETFTLNMRHPRQLNGQLYRASLWVHSNMYRHRLVVVFENYRGETVRVASEPLLWHGWKRIEFTLPRNLYELGRQTRLNNHSVFRGFVIESNPHGDAGDVALMLDNFVVLADLAGMRYPGSEVIDDF